MCWFTSNLKRKDYHFLKKFQSEVLFNQVPRNILLKKLSRNIIPSIKKKRKRKSNIIPKKKKIMSSKNFPKKEMLCLQYFHKIFITNLKWQIVIGRYWINK